MLETIKKQQKLISYTEAQFLEDMDNDERCMYRCCTL